MLLFLSLSCHFFYFFFVGPSCESLYYRLCFLLYNFLFCLFFSFLNPYVLLFTFFSFFHFFLPLLFNCRDYQPTRPLEPLCLSFLFLFVTDRVAPDCSRVPDLFFPFDVLLLQTSSYLTYCLIKSLEFHPNSFFSNV
ncbi:hypothetical protein DFH27DRAFT_28729 [Peziza echinospora]|nr:hypothetical protein DFH27DRAFT_28729 [Peziza echinospora]